MAICYSLSLSVFSVSLDDFPVKTIGVDRSAKREMSEEISPNSQEGARDLSSRSATHWREFDNSVNAVSFGFVATAILVSMFLVMALFERFLRPTASSSSSSAQESSRAMDSNHATGEMHCSDKLEEPSIYSEYAVGVSVVMPGEDGPTFIARPAPMPMPCPPQGFRCIKQTSNNQGNCYGSCSCRCLIHDDDPTCTTNARDRDAVPKIRAIRSSSPAPAPAVNQIF